MEDRRRTPRYPFVANGELREGKSEDKMSVRIKELGLNGCYIEAAHPFPPGTSLGIKIFTGTEYFEAQAKVIYSKPNLGMGLTFQEIKPFFRGVLRKWLLSAMLEK